jgi:RNA polymerase sigma-70 factor (ECF subfamily)
MDNPDERDQLSASTLHVLERARNGDASAARILIERALPSIRRWARGRLPQHARSDANTEDVVQDVFLRTLRRLRGFEHRTVGGLQAYLRRAVVNRIRDLIRGSNRVGLEPLADVEPRDWKPSPLEAAIMRQQLDGFLAALQRLKPADRQVIVWRIELGYTAEEIAAKLGKSTAAAGMTISRATARLAKEMRLVLDPPV